VLARASSDIARVSGELLYNSVTTRTLGGELGRGRRIALGAAIVCAATGGCGGSSVVSRSAVKVSVIAPTDGAIVSVRSLEVLGNVYPRDAVVLVSGRRASLEHGTFRLPIRLTTTVTHIAIDATAPGYSSSTTRITIRYQAPPRSSQSATQPAGSSASPPPPLPAARADRLCAVRNTKVTALPPTTSATVVADATFVENLNAELVDALRSLTRRSSAESTLGSFVSGLQAASIESAAISRDLILGRVHPAAQLFAKEHALAEQLDSQASALTIPDCGKAALLLGGSGRE
jgi:hypothetical protein